MDEENLATLVDKLENETVDLVLTQGSYEYVEQAELVNIIDYDMPVSYTHLDVYKRQVLQNMIGL